MKYLQRSQPSKGFCYTSCGIVVTAGCMVSPLIGNKNGWVTDYRKCISSIFDTLTVPVAPFNICCIPSMRGFHIGGL